MPPKPNKADEDFDSLLNTLAQAETSRRSDQPPKPQKPPAAGAGSASALPNAPIGSQVSTSEMDLLREQIERCWNPPAGAKDAKDLRVEIHIDVASDGTILDSSIVDMGRYASDPYFRAAADSARRATLQDQCKKLQVPLDKYDQWRSINLFFDPKDIQ